MKHVYVSLETLTKLLTQGWAMVKGPGYVDDFCLVADAKLKQSVKIKKTGPQEERIPQQDYGKRVRMRAKR